MCHMGSPSLACLHIGCGCALFCHRVIIERLGFILGELLESSRWGGWASVYIYITCLGPSCIFSLSLDLDLKTCSMFPYEIEGGTCYYVCPECRVYRHSSRVRLQSHHEGCIKKANVPAVVSFSCAWCDRVFRSRSWLTRHVRSHHSVVASASASVPDPVLEVVDSAFAGGVPGSPLLERCPLTFMNLFPTRLDFARTSDGDGRFVYNCAACTRTFCDFYGVLQHYAWDH